MKRKSFKRITALIMCTAVLVAGSFAFDGFTESDVASAAKIPAATGTVTDGNSKVAIDVSNTNQGYIMIKYLGTVAKVKIQITKSGCETYTYTVSKNGQYEAYPFSLGSGSYSVKVFENISGTKYAQAFSNTYNVALAGDFLPFLYSNQYVDFTDTSKTVAKGAELCKGKTKTLEKVTAVYSFVVKNFTYDKEKAATVKSGYLPNVDNVLAAKKGICFDYAAVMAAMLRSQDIPTKLVVGYAGNAYHAWINVYSAEEGWIEKVIYFDGKTWKLMDPTFASSGKESASIMKYIGDGSHYTMKYVY